MGRTLQDVMSERNISRYHLSKISGIPWATLSDICSGKTALERCSAGTVLKLSRALGMTMEETMDLETGEISRLDGPLDRTYLEADVPPDLRKAISDLLAARADTHCTQLDCFLDEVYGSINANHADGRITDEQAAYLHSKYLCGEEHD